MVLDVVPAVDGQPVVEQLQPGEHPVPERRPPVRLQGRRVEPRGRGERHLHPERVADPDDGELGVGGRQPVVPQVSAQGSSPVVCSQGRADRIEHIHGL